MLAAEFPALHMVLGCITGRKSIFAKRKKSLKKKKKKRQNIPETGQI